MTRIMMAGCDKMRHLNLNHLCHHFSHIQTFSELRASVKIPDPFL